jgi:2-amino-4-hydroxy-6-hydroxymethyldihydropteridine diphosphokinase
LSTRAYVALGSNLGDRGDWIARAVDAMGALSHTHIVACSSIVETAAWGDSAQGPYLNAVIALETTLSPERLLVALQTIEKALGRVRDPTRRFGPRTIDLDLLAYGEETRASEQLTLPHPRARERAFVLEPLREIAPTHPLLVGTTPTPLTRWLQPLKS